MAKARYPYIFAVYAHLDELIAAVKTLRAAGYGQFQVFSPVPHHEIEHVLERKPSPVRVYTLVGGLLGLAVGWGITIGPISNYDLHVGGKPLISFPPFGVVAYICTILFGAVATLIGMVINARLPQISLVTGYDERVSSDHFGVQVFCAPEKFDSVTTLMRSEGALDVKSFTPG